MKIKPITTKATPNGQRPTTSLAAGVAFKLSRFIVILALIVIGVSLSTSTLASAKPHSDMDPTEEMKSWLYYNSMMACINKAGITGSSIRGTTSPEGVNSSKWFNAAGSFNTRSIGYAIAVAGVTVDNFPGNLGKAESVECGGSNIHWIKDAVSLWGYSSMEEAWCDFTGNLNRKDGSVCSGSASSTGWDQNRATDAFKENFQKAIKKRIYDNKEPWITGAGKYVLARNSFYGGCLGTPKPVIYAQQGGGDKVFTEVPVVDGEGAISKVTFAGVNSKNHSLKYYVAANVNGSYENGVSTCQGLVTKMADHAADYSAAIKYLIATGGSNSDLTEALPEGTTEESSSSCLISGVGWLVCPILGFMGAITDGMYSMIDGLLQIDSNLVSTDSATYRGWEIMRNIANVGLVIVFLIIIFSQLTSFGISNYGIKRMLPRLVIAVILINVSYLLCQIAVDISNILGSSLKSTIDAIPIFSGAAEDRNFWSEGNVVSNVIISILAGGSITIGGVAIAAAAGAGVIYFGGVGLLAIIILSGLLAVAITFLIIAARMALAVILVVIAPIAFLAMVLPNTKNWFSKWQKIFIAVLAIYPMIALVFGMSQLASNIVITTAAENADAGAGTMMLVVGIGVALVPLFAVIPMIKGSLDAVPGIGKFAQRFSKENPLGGQVRSGIKGVRTGALNSGKGLAMSGKFGRGAQRLVSGGARRNQRAQETIGNMRRTEAALVAENILANQNASVGARSSAISTLSKLEEEEVANIIALDKHEGMSAKDHIARAANLDPSVSKAQRIASIKAIGAEGGQGDADKLYSLSSTPGLGLAERQAIASVAATRSSKNPATGGVSIKEMTDGTYNEHEAYKRFAKGPDFTAKSVVGMSAASRKSMLDSLSGIGANGAPIPGYRPDPESTKGMERVLSQIENSKDLQSETASVNDIRSAIHASKTLLSNTLGQQQPPTQPSGQSATPPVPATSIGGPNRTPVAETMQQLDANRSKPVDPSELRVSDPAVPVDIPIRQTPTNDPTDPTNLNIPRL